MDDQNQFAASSGTTPPSDGSTASDPQGASAGNPFAATSGDQATPATPVAGGVTDTPPWLNFNPGEAAAATPVAETPAPVENTFDPFSNPFDAGFGTAAPAADTPVEPVAQMADSTTGSVTAGDDDAMNLLVKLQQQFEYEEHDFKETLEMHEENIKAEQEAIRELRQKRKERMEEMKKIILGLEKLVGLTHEKSEASAPKKESTSNAARPARKTDVQSAKKVNSDDFFTAA